jgi:ubiquinone biosynthesis protein
MTAALRDDGTALVPTARVQLGRLGPGEAKRLVDVLAVLARHGVLTVARTGGTLALHPRRQPPRALAVALRRSFVELGPTFVKLGQLMASSPGLFPDTLATEMRRLLDDVPAEPARRIVRIVERQLGVPIARAFASFDLEPLAAASIAQVHRARLPDGTDVVVKVRRPHLRGRVERDLRLLRLLATSLARLGALGRAANPVAIVDDLAVTMREELDLRREARDMEAFAADLARTGRNPRVVVPRPIRGMVGERVLVMTYVAGVPVDDVASLRAAGHDLEELVRVGVRAWMEGAFVHGLFHGDMHAGNLVITPAGDVAFLDFGIMGRLAGDTREVLLRLLPALTVERDYAAVLRALVELGGADGPLDLERAVADVEALVAPHVEKPLGEIAYGEVLDGVLRVARAHRIQLPRELVGIVKQLAYFERYVKELAPQYEMFSDPANVEHLLAAMATPPRS